MINYPIQPLKEGRFEANPIVEWLATEYCDMNKIAVWCAENNIDNKYKEQLAQLVGYSLSGYETLSYVSDESYDRAAALEKPKSARTEYEKVTGSIFDLRDEFERGELYCKHEHAREYTQVTNTQTLAQALHGGFCFRRVEKEIDWRDESHGHLANKTGFHWSAPIAEVINDESDCFLELCRVALRANGEIE